jgi:NAD(P)-dependent dehydrogenase (short-subunit alcohol dehydrogenase family)
VPVLSRFQLDGKVAIVTGASSGLGVAFAEALAEAGADVAIGARRVEKLQETKALVDTTGRWALAVRTDVTVVEDCHSLVDATMAEFGRVDILVNNAGDGGEYHAATEDPPEQFRRVVDLNLMGSYCMAQAVGRVMFARQFGDQPLERDGADDGEDARRRLQLRQGRDPRLTRDLAAQWGEKGIRVNVLMPGTFPSEQTAHYSENYKKLIIKARMPLGRVGDPEDIAAAAVFLASDASSYITGVTLPVDGGVLLT